jgi:hypothetical protein
VCSISCVSVVSTLLSSGFGLINLRRGYGLLFQVLGLDEIDKTDLSSKLQHKMNSF